MEQSIVDIPKVAARGENGKYNLAQLKDLPAGKALRMNLTSATEVRTARGVVWNFCKRHGLKARTHHSPNSYVLFAWVI